MFHGVEHIMPRVTPPLDPAKVSSAIISSLNEGRSQDIKLPFYVNGVGLLRLLPIEFADWIRNVFVFINLF
jgi:hypothetical protein